MVPITTLYFLLTPKGNRRLASDTLKSRPNADATAVTDDAADRVANGHETIIQA